MTITQPTRVAAAALVANSLHGGERLHLPLPGELSGPSLFDGLPRGVHVGDGDVSFGPARGQRDEMTIQGPYGFINVCAQDGRHWIELVGKTHPDLGLHEPWSVRTDLHGAADRLGIPAADLAPLLQRAGMALVWARAELDAALPPNGLKQRETNMAEQNIDAAPSYRDTLRMDPTEALTMGVEGAGQTADNERLRRALNVIAQYDAVDDRAFAAARGSGSLLDPSVPEPPAARLLVLHGGNVSAAANDPGFERLVATYEGLQPGHEIVNDEDGLREEYVDPLAVPGNKEWLAERVAELQHDLGAPSPVEKPVDPVAPETEPDHQNPYSTSMDGQGASVDATDAEQAKIDAQDVAAVTFNPEAMDAVADGRLVVMEPSYGGVLENSDVVVTAAATGRGDVLVRVDADHQVHADLHLAGGTVLDANPQQVADTLRVDPETARQTVLAAAHQLQRGQVAYEAREDVDAAVAAFDQHRGQQAREALHWGNGPTSQSGLQDATQQVPSDLAEARGDLRSAPRPPTGRTAAVGPWSLRSTTTPVLTGVMTMDTRELVDQVEASLAQAQHFLGIADYDIQSATAGAQRRALEGTPLPGMVAAHRDAAAEAYDALQRGSEHVNHGYAGVIALTKAPHLTDENHDWVVGTLAGVVEAMVAASKATPHLEAGTTHLFAANNPAADPRSVSSQLVKARDELSLAIPHVSTAARVVDQAAARRSPDGQVGPAQPLARAQARQQMAVPTTAGTQPAGPRR
jgi:hypothetical protein